MEMKTGIRQSAEDLEKSKKAKLESKFQLKEQKKFKGSPETLLQMQQYERLYREGKPAISDEEWDKLVALTGYEESLDETVSPDGRTWIKFKTPLVSLKKVTSMEDLKDYISKFPESQRFIVEPKLDGLTFCAMYKEVDNGDFGLYAITTRGDGINGLKLYEDALYGVETKGLPNTISKKSVSQLRENGCVVDEVIEIRGEAVISRFDYSKEPYNNFKDIVARSIAAGIFNRKNPNSLMYLIRLFESDIEYKDMSKEQKKALSKAGLVNSKSKYDSAKFQDGELYLGQDGNYVSIFDAKDIEPFRIKETLDFISYSISTVNGNVDLHDIPALIDGLIYFDDIGEFSNIFKITDSIEDIIKSVDSFYGTNNFERDYKKLRLKNVLNYAVDGIVVKPVGSNNISQKIDPKEKAGKIVLAHHPADQIAIKLPTDYVVTTIEELVYRTTNLGNTTISAKVTPVTVEGGAVVSQVNLHNPNWLAMPENQWIKEGVKCKLQMSMDIIPIISEFKE